MSRLSDASLLTFVSYDGPKLHRDPGVRRLIRQHAMRDVAAARRQRGDYGRQNIGQYPQVLEKELSNEDVPIPEETSPPAVQKQQSLNLAVSDSSVSVFYTPMGSSGLVKSEEFSLLLNYMPLTGLCLGTATFSSSTSEPAQNKDIFSAPHLGSRKLLSFIPSRYGQVSSLSHATDCVVAKLRQMMQPPACGHSKEEALVLWHYAKALSALQSALNNETQQLMPETLYATELLGIFEMLRGSQKPQSWIRHVGGAARLIELRDPHRFHTEFKMALFMAHVGPTVMEAFLSNKLCFLADEPWLEVMRSAICNDESLTDQKDVVLSLWGRLVRGPKLLKDATDIIFSPTTPPRDVIDSLIDRLLNSRKYLLYWLSEIRLQICAQYGSHEDIEDGNVLPWHTFESHSFGQISITQLALMGTSFMCLILKDRLLFALAPARFPHLEAECQDLAARIIGLRQKSTTDDGQRLVWSLILSQSAWITKGTLDTKETFSVGL